jgi:hypothetical protein
MKKYRRDLQDKNYNKIQVNNPVNPVKIFHERKRNPLSQDKRP